MPPTTNQFSIVFISTFPPRTCGIATFTSDLIDALDGVFGAAITSHVIAMKTEDDTTNRTSPVVIGGIRQDHLDDYRDAAARVNALEEVRLVNIQHEFGIFGGEYGINLLAFLEVVKKPVVITFHTVLPGPNDVLRAAVQALAARVAGIIVMTLKSKEILKADYGVDDNLIHIIPHGIHPMENTPPHIAKETLGMPDRIVVSTFGFLNRGKGIEFVIEALPEVVRAFPDVLYRVIGISHPEIVKREGEVYREFLERRVAELGLGRNVEFVKAFFGKTDLLKHLAATDLYIATPLDPNQAVSGTLSYAMGAGRPVIATTFLQAREYITDDIGELVPFRDSVAISAAILKLLGDPGRLVALGQNAFLKTRKMTWPNVAIAAMKVYTDALHESISGRNILPRIKLDHLVRMTDDFGMFQFAIYSQPDPAYGYTIDDNARALMAVVEYGRVAPLVDTARRDLLIGSDSKPGGEPPPRRPSAPRPENHLLEVLPLVRIYLDFMAYVAEPSGTFVNYVKTSREISAEENDPPTALEDANGRAILALATVIAAEYLPADVRAFAKKLLDKRLEQAPNFGSIRAGAFLIKAIALLCGKPEYQHLKPLLVRHCELLVSRFEESSNPEWIWFEDRLTYSNGLLPEALLRGYQATGNRAYCDLGRKTLDFLIANTFRDNLYMPIGQLGWFVRDKERVSFDQQAEDSAAMIQALNTLVEIMRSSSQENISDNSNTAHYQTLMEKCFGWFLGQNVLGQNVYDPATGGCYDGIGHTSLNLNQGAESTISYLASRLMFR